MSSGSFLFTDVSLPAVFMPNKSNNMNIFNPRAHNYFHTAGQYILTTFTVL